MNQDKLRRFCFLPTARVEVEKKTNPDKKGGHIIYWEWVALDGTRPQAGAKPQNKIGKWKIFVDVISPNKAVQSYDVNESDEAWEKLFEAAKNAGYSDDDVEAHETIIDLQNGTLRVVVKKMLTDEGMVPELKFVYADKDDLYKNCIEVGLGSKKELQDIVDVLTEAIKSL